MADKPISVKRDRKGIPICPGCGSPLREVPSPSKPGTFRFWHVGPAGTRYHRFVNQRTGDYEWDCTMRRDEQDVTP